MYGVSVIICLKIWEMNFNMWPISDGIGVFHERYARGIVSSLNTMRTMALFSSNRRKVSTGKSKLTEYFLMAIYHSLHWSTKRSRRFSVSASMLVPRA